MHDAHHFLNNLALVLCVAALTTAIFQRLRQPIVLGYMLAGAIVSPYTPFPLFADEGTIHAFSELGVILLMFSLGLEFNLAKLLRVGPTAGLVGVIQCSLMMWLGYITAQLLGWTVLEGLYTGALIAISSTTIIVKAFAEQKIRGRLTEIVFGVLIVEDLIAILLLAVLTTISGGSGLTATGLATTVSRLAAFLAVVVGGGLFIVPRLMRKVVELDRPETTVVTSVGLCFGFALLADAAGYSVALGAFLGGALVAESGEGEVVEHLVQPVRDIFAAVFFISVGMLINPVLVAQHWVAVVLLTVIVVVGKLIGVGVGVFLTGEGIRTSVKAGMSLAQIGEFSFIIAGVGLASGATGAFLYPIAVTVSALTTLLTPWLIRASDPFANWLQRRLPEPVQTFAALYGTWVENLRAGPREASTGRRLRRLGGFLLLDTALLAAILIATAVWGGEIAVRVALRFSLSSQLTGFVVLAAAIVTAAPFCIGVARCTAALARTLAATALPRPDGGVDLADAPRRVLVITLEIAVLLLVGAPLVVLTSPFLPPLSGPLLLTLVMLLLALALWRSATNLQEHTRAGAEVILEAMARQLGSTSDAADAEDPDLERLHKLLPGLGAPRPVRIGADSAAVGKTLIQLDLRGSTGATVLAIVRANDGVLVPTGRETLRAGDVLAVAGTAGALASVEELLGHVQ